LFDLGVFNSSILEMKNRRQRAYTEVFEDDEIESPITKPSNEDQDQIIGSSQVVNENQQEQSHQYEQIRMNIEKVLEDDN
jgi:phosphoribosylaminoimidazole-succinocarboxamide synthase